MRSGKGRASSSCGRNAVRPGLRRGFILLILGIALAILPGDSPPTYPLHAGIRVSRGKHFDPFPGTAYFDSVGRWMAGKLPRSRPALIWIVGLYWGDDDTGLSFPKPTGTRPTDFPNVHFAARDLNEAYLLEFDRRGIDVWLQVEPGDADVERLIDLTLSRYRHHPCVVGFGVDIEWFRKTEAWDGRAVTDAEVRAWDRRVKSHNPSYRIFLKHYMSSKMPPTVRGDVLFINDSQGFRSLRAMVHEFRGWGRRFSPAEVGFQFGYPLDRKWWNRTDDPAGEIVAQLNRYVPNARWFFWVDFTALEVYPDRDR